jgi:sigma-B regulation protein RsbU (phosphoserine phosphatase)
VRRPASTTLAQRIQGILAAFFVLLAVNAGFAVSRFAEHRRAVDAVRRLDPAVEAANILMTSMADQETGLRGYVITGDAQFLGPYEAGLQEATRALADLEDMLVDQPELLADLAALEEGAERWRRAAAEPEIAATRVGDRQRAVAIVRSGVGRRIFNELRTRIVALREDIAGVEQEAQARLDAAQERMSRVLYTTFVLGGMLLVAGSVLLRRWITVPFTRVSTAVRLVADGELEHQVPAEGPRDLADLGRDVERMRRRIVAELDEANRAREALEQQGPLVVTLRQQLSYDGADLPEALTLATRFAPAEGVLAGDWYDVMPLDGRRVALAVVDVSGHGPASGVLALRAKQLLLAALRQQLPPGQALGWLADHLGDTGEDFLTAFTVDIDLDSGACRYASAGHPPALLADDDGVRELGPTGPLLGPLRGAWGSGTFRLDPGTLLSVYTDGLVEARDPDGREFGAARVRDLAGLHHDAGPEAFVEACMAALDGFGVGRLADDLTLIALSRAAAAVGAGVEMVPETGAGAR